MKIDRGSMPQQTLNTLPDYHFLYIPENLAVGWLFDAARRYVARFRPTVISTAGLIALVPRDATVTVNVLCRRDQFRVLAVDVAQARDDAQVDPLLFESVDEARLALDARAELNQPFGVPLQPTAIPPTVERVQPTPGALAPFAPVAPTLPAAGFVTQAPTRPPGFITQTPSPTPPPADEPVDPTPGSVVGG